MRLTTLLVILMTSFQILGQNKSITVDIKSNTTETKDTNIDGFDSNQLKNSHTLTYLPNKKNSNQISTKMHENQRVNKFLLRTENDYKIVKKELKKLNNRVSTLECCVSLNNGSGCEGLTKKDNKRACDCRKRLKLIFSDGLRCEK